MIVTEQDLVPYGWVCESCREPFKVGDMAYGAPIGVTEGGALIEGEYRCLRCYANDREIANG